MSDQQEKRYYRASLGLKQAVAGTLAQDYHSTLVDGMRAANHHVEVGGVSFTLATAFGFCYGVDKAVDMAYEAREKFPGKRIFLLTEIIHNPRVNRRMLDMGIIFLSGQYKSDQFTEADIGADDVVLIPAFGAAHDQLEELKARGAILVDTTCGSVVHVWKRVERYARDGYCSLVHGKYYHEETIATVSQATKEGGHFVVVRNMDEADAVCRVIRGEMDGKALLAMLPPGAVSDGFDPGRDLRRVGVANQTTMLASESLEIARRIGDALQARFGEGQLADHFRSFDTICSATQDRQDAMKELVDKRRLDLILVIGGFNSSNTGHLLEVALENCSAYHVEDASDLLAPDRIRHLPLKAKQPVVEQTAWFPPGVRRVGLTAGASTPNKAIADAMVRLLEFRGFGLADALAVIDEQAPLPGA